MLPNVGTWEMIIILLVIFLLFGANRLPDITRGLARGIREFKSEMQGITSQIEEVRDQVMDETKDIPPSKPAPPLKKDQTPEVNESDESPTE